MLARLHHRMGTPEQALQILEQQVQNFPDATDLTHINILAELLMDAGQHERAWGLIRRAEQLPCMQDGVPIDLTVRAPLLPASLQGLNDSRAWDVSCICGPALQEPACGCVA